MPPYWVEKTRQYGANIGPEGAFDGDGHSVSENAAASGGSSGADDAISQQADLARQEETHWRIHRRTDGGREEEERTRDARYDCVLRKQARTQT